MSRITAQETISSLLHTRFLPLFNVEDADVCKHIIRSCYAAGLRTFELTNRDSSAYRVFCELVPFVEAECPELSLGVGTVTDRETAEKFLDAGADFIVAPIFDAGTLEICREQYVPYIPGCFTPSELFHAHRSGCAFVKLFPAGTLGPDYVRNIIAPMPRLKIVGTGGVQFDEASVKRWFNSGIAALGIGSSVFTKDRLSRKDYAAIEADLKAIMTY